MKQNQKMAELFKVEELEERLEFADWTASAETDGSETTLKLEVTEQTSW